MVRRWVGRSAFSGLVVGAALLLLATSATAACNPGRVASQYGSHLSGGVSFPRAGVLGNSETTITYYSPYVQSGSSVSAWTMLTRASCTAGIVQAGWLTIPLYGYARGFYEWENCANYGQGPRFDARVGPVTTHFKVQHSTSNPGVVTAYAGSILMLGNTQVDWVPNEVQVFSETHNVNDQNYGAVNAQQQFSNFTQCDGSGCYSNADFCLTAGNQAPGCVGPTSDWLHLTITGSPRWTTYDRDCLA